MQGVAGGQVSRDLRLEPVDVAAVTEQVSFQWVTAVVLFVVQLETTVLTVVTLHMVVLVHRNNPDGFLRALGWKDGLAAGGTLWSKNCVVVFDTVNVVLNIHSERHSI